MSSSSLHVVGVAGSLRSGSFNRRLLAACDELAPDGLEIERFDLGSLPLYNQDLDTDSSRPSPVRQFKELIDRADAMLIVSPEYNYGVPGVMKNALDWTSRPSFKSPMYHKPTGIMGASAGASGTMRGQEHLKLNLLGMASQVFPHPGVAVSRAGDRFDQQGRLTDEDTRNFVAKYLTGFREWVLKVR